MSAAIKKTDQWLFFLRQLRTFEVSLSSLSSTALLLGASLHFPSLYNSACQKGKGQLERIVRTSN